MPNYLFFPLGTFRIRIRGFLNGRIVFWFYRENTDGKRTKKHHESACDPFSTFFFGQNWPPSEIINSLCSNELTGYAISCSPVFIKFCELSINCNRALAKEGHDVSP